MSLNIGELVAYVKIDHGQVGPAIVRAQNDMRQGMGQVAREAGQGGQKAGKEAGSQFSGAFKTGLKGLAGGIIGYLAVDKAVQGLNTLKNSASDLNETASMAGIIFGKNADAMNAWAKDGAKNIGLSTEATLRQSAAFADMLLQIGYTEDGAASASKSVLQMAADLGSFKNMGTEDVLERISAGFRGEYDSLQLLIPNISAARVQSEALAATGKKNAESLTAQEKAAATLAIIQKDGSRAMGDFARTANDNANASKTAAAMTEDLKAKVGQGLLPAYTALVVFGRDQVIPFLSATVDKMGAAADATKPLTGELGDLVSTFRSLPEPVQATTLGLIAMVALRGRVVALGTGLQTKVAGGATAASSAMTSLRLHMMYAGEAAGTASNRFTAAGKAIGYAGSAGLRGAASGLLGLLGGPWGVAFIAATAGLTLFINEHQKAKDEVEELTAAIEADSGALGKNTRERVKNALETSGVLRAASEMGLNLQDVTDAALGFADAQERVNDAIARQRDQMQDPGLNLGAYRDLIEKRRALVKVEEGIGNKNDAVRDAVEQSKRLAAADGETTAGMGKLDAATTKSADATRDNTAATKDQTDEQKKLADAARKTAQAVLDVYDAQLKASGATIDYQDALANVQERLAKRKELEAELAKAGGSSDRTKKLQDDLARATDPKKRAKLERDLAQSRAKDASKGSAAKLRKELEEYGGGIDVRTKAGRENQKLLDDLADSAKGKAKADLEAGVGIKALRDNMAAARKDFIANARSLNVSTRAAEQMANKYGLTTEGVDNLAKSVDNLPASKQIKIEAETAAAQAALDTLAQQLSRLANTNIVVTAQGRFVNTGTLPGGGKNLAGGSTKNEDGGFYGGTARMFGPGEGIKHVFNEPRAGGESFIPHSPSKRGTATAVLAQTAELFGFGLVPSSVTNTTTTNAPIHIGQVVTNDWAKLERQARDRRRRDALGRRRAR